MSNHIILDIGDRNPASYWEELEARFNTLYRSAIDSGRLRREADLDTMIFFHEFLLILATQHPDRSRRPHQVTDE
jgi:hypothetical protein